MEEEAIIFLGIPYLAYHCMYSVNIALLWPSSYSDTSYFYWL